MLDKITMKSFVFKPIGVIRTPYTKLGDVPHQPSAAAGVTGEIEIFPQFRPGLSDLKGFERIWLLFWCHLAEQYSLKVVPGRDVVHRGLFATRAPCRPNPIGLSAVRLLDVNAEAGFLKIADVDVVSGTPLLDIKPYIPDIDCHPDVRVGWLDDVKAGGGAPGGRSPNDSIG